MIRRYFLFGLITLLFTVSNYAQYEQTGGFARLRGMGNNPYIVDPYFMTVNPAWGGHYQNFLFGDLGSQQTPWGSGGNGQFVGVNFHLGGGFNLGAMLTRNDFLGFGISRLDPGGLVGQINTYLANAGFQAPSPAGYVVPLNNNLELMASLKTGNTVFGLGVAYASSNSEFAPAQGDGAVGSARQLGFNLGIVSKLTGSLLLDLGASLVMPGADFEPAQGQTTEFSQTIILANARVFWRYSSKLQFVPTVAFLTASGSSELGTSNPNGQSTSTDLPSVTVFTVGLGANYEVGDFLLAGGLGLASASTTNPGGNNVPETSNSVFVFPAWNLGVEWDLLDWLVGRFGYVATTLSNSQESANGQNVDETIFTSFGGPYGVSGTGGGATVGVGFRFGNFSLDATVNEDVLRQGFNNFGGNGGGANTFAYISLSYAMP